MLFELYRDNYLKVNSGKFHVTSITDNKLKINIKGSLLSNKKTVKLLGVAIDNKINKPDLNLVCEKFVKKSGISRSISKKKLRVILMAFTMSQFSYCPVLWMYHSRTLNNKVNKLHEKTLRFIYDGRKSKFEELLYIDKSITIHHRNLQVLPTELYKVHSLISL